PVIVRSRRKHALIGPNTDVSAESFTLEAYREALVEPETQIRVSKDLTVSSTGNKADSRAVLRQQSNVQAGEDIHLISGNQAKILEQATVQVGENLEMNARKLKKCTVAPDAEITYDTKSGNCAPALP
ncbi:MAG: hypothetical protein U9R74_09005, partial [Pseudomonadota bacterium]|nr:hypothetical protein [Pseudomonadota bacterium]